MSKLNRKARRAAAVTSGAGKATVTLTSGAGKPAKLTFDASRPLVRKAIDYAVAHETTVAASAMVEQFKLNTAMCNAHQAKPEHARELLDAVRKRIAVKRGIEFKPAEASRVHEWKKVISLHSFACLTNLIKVLDTFEYLTLEHLYTVAAFMIGTRDTKPGWRADVVGAPTKEVLERVIRLSKKRDTKSTKRTKSKTLAVGMPTTDPKRGALHIVKCAKAFIKANPELMKSEHALLAGIIRNAEMLAKEAAPRIVKARADAAAE